MKTKDYLEELKDHYLEQVLDEEKFKAFYLREKPDSRMMSTLFIFSPEGIVLMGDLTPQLHSTASCLGYGLAWFAGRLSETYLCEKFLEKRWNQELAVEELNETAKRILAGSEDDNYGDDEFRKVSDERHGLHEDLKTFYKDLKEAKRSGTTLDEMDLHKSIVETREEILKLRAPLSALRRKCSGRFSELAHETDGGAYGPETFYQAYSEIEADVESVPGWGYSPRERYLLCALQQKFSELYHAKIGTKAED